MMFSRKVQPADELKEENEDVFTDNLMNMLKKSRDEGSISPQNHPELEDLFFIDETTSERAYPNGVNIEIDNELFTGVACPMIRTSDADASVDANTVKGSASNDITSDYFRSKKRRFEIQFELKLKKIPEGQIFLGCEMDKPIEFGAIYRTIVEIIMTFIKKRNVGFFYNICGEEETPEGHYEKPHLSFLLESCCDRFIITKPGEVAPKLGSIIHEDPESFSRRKKGAKFFDWNTEDTYTVAIWSAYADFNTWECLNLPAVPKFSLNSIIAAQVFRICLYVADSNLKRHRQSDNSLCFLRIWKQQKVKDWSSSKGLDAESWDKN